MAQRRPLPRRSRRRGRRRSARSQHVLLRLDRRRRVEDGRRRPLLGEHVRRLLQARVGGRDRGVALRSERDLRRHGRELHPRQRLTRRRGGQGSGIVGSKDAGDTRPDISHARGLRQGILGKSGIAASAAKSGRVFAIVEAEDGAVFRSDDGGDNWERGSEDRNLRQRAWYYNHIYADPKDPETAWVLNVDAWRSNDGGKTFVQMSIPHGDHHDLWIDPDDPNRMIEGNDGGGVVTFNGGESWSG